MYEQISRKVLGREKGSSMGTLPSPPTKPVGMDSECGGFLSDPPHTIEIQDSRLGRALVKKKARKGDKREGAKL